MKLTVKQIDSSKLKEKDNKLSDANICGMVHL